MKTLLSLHITLLVLLCLSCTQSAYLGKKQFSNEFGKINISVSSKGHQDSVTFNGKFVDIETGKIPPASAVIIIDSTSYLLDKKGTYSVTLKYKENVKLTAFTSPYFIKSTGEIKVKKGKTYKVDFYLKEDTNPIVD